MKGAMNRGDTAVTSDTLHSSIEIKDGSENKRPTHTKRERLAEAVQTARSFAVVLFLIIFGIKIMLFFSGSAIVLRTWEWIPIWPVMSYQHLIFAVLCFCLYAGLLFLGSCNRPLAVAMLVAVAVVQLVIPFLHISSLRVEQIIGSYTTFEMTQADSDGSIFNKELFEKANLPFTLSGLILSLSAVIVPLVLKGPMRRLLSFLTVKRTADGISVWIVIGIVGIHLIPNFIGVAGDDPVIFYYADMIEKKFGLF
jgi:hypothetical protein